jgi:PST family polysaccharide transporter
MTGVARFSRLVEGDGVAANLKTKSVRGGIVALVAESADFAIRFGSVAVLARLLVPEYFGLLSMVTAFTSIADRFKDLGLSMATIQRKEITHEQVSTLFWLNAGVGVAMMLGVFGCAYPLSLFYSDARLIPITAAIAISFPLSAMAIQHQALLRRQMKFTELAVVQIGSSILSLALAITMALKGFGYWALVAREVSRSVFMAAGTWVFMPWIPARPSRQAGVGSMLRFGGDVSASNLVWLLCSSLDQVLIGKLFGAVPLGFYRQGFQLVLAPVNQLSFPIQTVGEAALSRLQHDSEKYRRYYRKLLTILSLFTMPLVVFLAVYAGPFIRFTLGERWIGATPVFQVLTIAALLRPATATTAGVMLTCGHSRKFFWLSAITSVALALGFLAGIPWGPVGIAWAQVWSVYLLLVPTLYWSFKRTPISVGLFFSTIARPLTASLAMGIVLALFRKAGVVQGATEELFLGAVASVPVYFGFWMAMPGGPSNLRDLIADLSGPINAFAFFCPKGQKKDRSSNFTNGGPSCAAISENSEQVGQPARRTGKKTSTTGSMPKRLRLSQIVVPIFARPRERVSPKKSKKEGEG